MFDLINGLPVHPLVVHAVVVLLPLACLGTIAIAIRPTWRARYGVLVVACAAAATVLIPVATSSGEALEKHVGRPGEHAEQGDQLILFAIPLLALSLVLVWLDRNSRALSVEDPAGAAQSTAAQPTMAKPTTATRVIAVLALSAAVATSVQVYRVGDSGARAAWGERVQTSSVLSARSAHQFRVPGTHLTALPTLRRRPVCVRVGALPCTHLDHGPIARTSLTGH